MVEHSEIRVVRCGGSKINFREPLITLDSKFLLCASGDSVKVYSTSTEECIHILQGHTDLVTGIVLNPANHLQVYSCSLDGTVRLWDYTDGILIKTLSIGYKITALFLSKKHEGVLFVIIPMASDTDAEAFQLVAVHLPSSAGQEVEARELSSVLTDVSAMPRATSFGRGGDYIASAKGLQLSVYFFRKQKTFRFFLKATDKKGAKNSFTCVCCHPKDDCIATGHEDGKIRLWRNFNQKKEYTYSTQHWHHDAVSALSFTPEGMNLLSGGIESVLVLWRYGAETKDLLPRLGAAIEHISVSPDGTLYCTSHSDNKITIINSNLKVSAVIQGLVKGEDVKTDLMIDPRTKALVLNGKPGHLQFYSLHHDKQLYNLDIVQQEYIHQSGLEQSDVVKAALHAHGVWLATIEERREKALDLETILKLWAYNEQTQSFELNTNISSPHDDRVTAMCFSPSADGTLLVTAGKDGHFKAWQLAEDWDSHREGLSWSCDFVGSYHHLRPTNCCFSADGSLLAVSFQEIITVWSPDSWELLLTLCQPPGDIRDLCFGRLSCSKYLLGTTSKNLLCCWNLLTCSLEWSTTVDVTVLQDDPLSENIAAFSHAQGNTDLFVFKPSEPRPLYSQKAVCSGKVHRAVFAPRESPLESCEAGSQWLNRSQLYFVTEHMDLMTFSTKSEDDMIIASSKQLVIDDSVAVTPFYLLLGKHRQQEKPSSLTNQMAARVQLPQGSTAIRELLHTPAHVLPSASLLCAMFVSSLLISNSAIREVSEPKEEEMESEAEEDQDSEEEMDSRDSRPVLTAQSSVGELAPTLSKAQERELRKMRKTDYSWLSGALHP
ncbi:WD repeat-containing protein 75 [Megalops cyprinoides]|uniref:WD repeat-containing protein 75 n=1 Tax=Megalops cyprinoides TaxID=118141 RepID=UPI0018654B16|nr:WD repeat-containing protein 75 [Megalops cyprinoides]